MDDSTLHLDEATARRLLLVRAIEDTDTEGRVLDPAEREQLEQDAVEAVRRAARGPAVDRGGYLRQRAQRLLAAVASRHPQLAALQDTEPWRRWVAWGLPVLALLLGLAAHGIDSPGRVNMLSPPLLAVVVWNLAVYAWLLLAWFLPRPWPQQSSFAAMQRWLAGWVRAGRRTGRLSTDVSARFYHQWLQHTATQQRLWWHQVLHATAAGWAAGLALSIVLGGLVRQYRVGWESTLLDPAHVHGLLAALFAPVVALTPLQGFSFADVQRMAFGAGAAIGVGEARQWIALYLGLLALLVIVPRTALAGIAAWRRHRLNHDVHIDLRDPYFVQVLARVSPTRVTLGFVAADAGSRAVLLRVLAQAAGRAAPAAGSVPWTVLATPKGDAVRLFEIPPGYAPPAPVKVTVHAGASAARAWLQEVVTRFRPARPPAPVDGVRAALDEADLVLLLPGDPGEVCHMARLLHWLERPALVLAPPGADLVAYRSEVRRCGMRADVLDLHECSANWSREPRLLEAVRGRLAPGQRAGFARIAEAWARHNHERLAQAMAGLAGWLLRAAREREEVGTGPLSLLRLVDASERDADLRARQAAMEAVQQRLRQSEAEAVAALMRLHGIEDALPTGSAGDADRLELQARVDLPQASVAGAASGAAIGAGIDLLTGGLTLGAATALGALIGTGAASMAAAWKNRQAGDAAAQVQLGDEMLQSLAERALLHYLAVVHRGRGLAAGEPLPSAWRSEVVACVEGQREALASLWRDARQAEAAGELVPPLAQRLEALARQVLARV